MRYASACCNIVLGMGAAVAAAGIFHQARADGCPGASVVERPFIVERDIGSKVSVFHLPDGIVRTIYRDRGNKTVETTFFQGLFPLERIDSGRRKIFQPNLDLKTFFPLHVGQKITANFDTEESGQQSIFTLALVVKKTDTLYIGACKYDVFQVEKNEGRGGRSPVFINMDYYSPNLKLVIAKEYKERNGGTSWIKYDKIYAVER